LALVDGNNPFTVVALDTAGNRLTNRYQAFLPVAQRLTYDLNGNLTGDGQRILEYDDNDRLTRVTEGNQQTEYAYDGYGRRHLRRELQQVNGAWLVMNTCYYVYAGWNVIREETTRGSVDYVHGLELLSRRSTVPGEETVYYETDANGNIVLLVNEYGQVVGRYEYDSYGNLLLASGPMALINRYRYSGKEYDPRTRLYYYGYRFYDPLWQRWTSRDLIEELGGINLYGFVGNDPINFVDPYGLAWYDWADNLGNWASDKLNTAKDYYNKNLSWGIAGTIDTGMDIVGGIGKFPQALAHLGEAEGTWWENKTWQNAKGMAGDVLTTAAVVLPAARCLTPVKGPFVPDEYWQRYAPDQVTPGIIRLDFRRISGRTGRIEDSRVIYDEFGRQKYRIDKTDHMRPADHSNPHLHEREYHPEPQDPAVTETRHNL